MEVQFTIYDVSIPPSISSFEQLVLYFQAPTITQNATSTISIGRRIHNTTIEYFGAINASSYKTLRFGEIQRFLESLSIQINTKGKFIIQQTSLLLSLQKKNTYLLEIIEESIGNKPHIEACADLMGKQKDLEGQRDCFKKRKEEIERYRHDNEHEFELEQRDADVRKEIQECDDVVNDLIQKKNELSNTLCQMEYDKMKKKETELKRKQEEVHEEEQRNDEEQARKEKALQEIQKQWMELKHESTEKEFMIKQLREQLRENQERLIINLDKQKELSEQDQSYTFSPEEEVLLSYKEPITRYVELQSEVESIQERLRRCIQAKQDIDEEIMTKERELMDVEKPNPNVKAQTMDRYKRMESEVRELRDRLAFASEAITHPKQDIIDRFMIRNNSFEAPQFFSSLPIRVREVRFTRAVNTVCQSHFKNTVVVTNRSVFIHVHLDDRLRSTLLTFVNPVQRV